MTDPAAPMTPPEDRACAATLRLLAARAPDATVCPSEVARAIAAVGTEGGNGRAGGDWRAAMPAVHAAVDRLIAAGAVRLCWRGQALGRRDGPYRIGRADARIGRAGPVPPPPGEHPPDV